MDITEVTGWRKPRRSFSNGNCLEAASWRTSSRSIGNGECLEAASTAAVVLVRDTKDRDGTVLSFGTGAWMAFTRSLRGQP